jgi:hypothetical protein
MTMLRRRDDVIHSAAASCGRPASRKAPASCMWQAQSPAKAGFCASAFVSVSIAPSGCRSREGARRVG